MTPPRRLAIWDPAALADPDGLLALDRLKPERAFAWDGVQLRSIFAAARTVVEQVAAAVQTLGLPLWINRDVAFAKEVRAQGVQFGLDVDRRSLDVVRAAGMAVGISIHNAAGAAHAAALGADLVIFAHVYATPSKPGQPGRGLDALAAAVAAAAPTPVLALGGVTLLDEPELRATGAWGLAAIRAAWRDW